MRFSQHIVVYSSEEQALRDLVEDDNGRPPGFLGGRLLKFRDKPGRYVIQVDFDSWDSAEASNDLPETRAWSDRLLGLIDGEPKYENLDVLLEVDS